MKSRQHNILTKLFFYLIISIFTTGVVVKWSQSANPAQLPATVGIGTHPVGGAYHAVGTGIAVLISDKTKIRAVVQPFAGPNAWMPQMQSGQLELGVLAATDGAWAYTGGFGYNKPYKNLRLVLRGNVVRSNVFMVLKRSRITKITDLKGKRVGSQYGGNQFIHRLNEAMLRSVGMTWKDVVEVPVPDTASANRLLREGRIDAGTTGAPTTPSAIELHTALGTYSLSYGDMHPVDIEKGIPSDKQAILDELVPGCFPSIAKDGVGVIEKDTVLITSPVYLAASLLLSDEAVYTILKVIWENYSDLHSVHPWLKEWIPNTMAAGNNFVPYHDGAVKFFKEKGVWTETMQNRQQKLLNQ